MILLSIGCSVAPLLARPVESPRLELHSSLSPSECATRLSKAIDWERLIGFSFTGSHPVIGRIDGTTFRLRIRMNYRNSFRAILTGSMQSHGDGTRIHVEFTIPGFTRVFVPIWLVGMAVLGCIGFEIALVTFFSGTSPHRGNAWVGLVVPPAMLLFGIYFARAGQASVRDETRFLTEFLREVLQANDVRND